MSFKAHYKLNVDTFASSKRAIEERLESLCLTNSHRQRSLTDAVLAILCWVGRNDNDVRSSLLSCVVAGHVKSKTGGALLVVVIAHLFSLGLVCFDERSF